jgi:hypothetical protein
MIKVQRAVARFLQDSLSSWYVPADVKTAAALTAGPVMQHAVSTEPRVRPPLSQPAHAAQTRCANGSHLGSHCREATALDITLAAPLI